MRVAWHAYASMDLRPTSEPAIPLVFWSSIGWGVQSSSILPIGGQRAMPRNRCGFPLGLMHGETACAWTCTRRPMARIALLPVRQDQESPSLSSHSFFPCVPASPLTRCRFFLSTIREGDLPVRLTMPSAGFRISPARLPISTEDSLAGRWSRSRASCAVGSGYSTMRALLRERQPWTFTVILPCTIRAWCLRPCLTCL